MATPVIMPRQGQSVESCIISKWHKKIGDVAKTGDLLFSYETDKAAFDEEAQVDGILLDIFFKEDDDVPVLTNVCVIGEAGEDTKQYNPHLNNENKEKDTGKQEEALNSSENTGEAKLEEKTEIPSTGPENESQRIKISPRARNYAEKSFVDYRLAVPSGPDGRIIERDVVALREKGPVITPAAWDEYKNSGSFDYRGTGMGGRITLGDMERKPASREPDIHKEEAKPEAAAANNLEFEEVKLSGIRRVIAKAMHDSLSNTAQLTLNTSFDASAILEYRSQLKKLKDSLGIENITLNDIIVFAVSRTLVKHKYLNAHYKEDKLLLFTNAHLGVAVDTERGLMVPTVYDANLKSLNNISSEIKLLVEKCKQGTINPDLLKGGTFTVTNLGSLGIESFTPILNPPQTGILGVNTITYKTREIDGSFKYYPSMGLSLTFDHRALDGAVAARFLQDLKSNLENFTVLLAK